MIPTWTYVKSDKAIYTNLFIGSRINVEKVAGTNVEMVQKTNYPWSGKISITVNPEKSKDLFTRAIRPLLTQADAYSSAGVKLIAFEYPYLDVELNWHLHNASVRLRAPHAAPRASDRLGMTAISSSSSTFCVMLWPPVSPRP